MTLGINVDDMIVLSVTRDSLELRKRLSDVFPLKRFVVLTFGTWGGDLRAIF